MFNRSKGWFPSLISKPKNPHSLEHLKYLYNVLCKNQTVTEQNRVLLVETLRSISEILIWGDQNDSSVFDFFLEKNMLTFFLRYMRQKFGRYICVQLLQTLNILFDNISNETSLYYLLSNNHINSIIVHKFDFSDEEVMAYYISFLKTLSLKLNKHTIHFFYNEHTNDFALYTEAIKFFNHSESMVRIAVRTITLNVYKVYQDFKDGAMLRYIRDRTAAPYFSNLVWFIGSHILDMDTCVRNDADHQSRDRLSSLVAEHLDHLHYVNDILLINIDALNDVLSDQLLNRLLVPLYVYSLTKRKRHQDTRPTLKKYVSSVVSLFLLSQVFLIIRHSPLVRQLAEIIFNGELEGTRYDTPPSDSPRMHLRVFAAPAETLEETLDSNRGLNADQSRSRNASIRVSEGNSTFYRRSDVPEENVITAPEVEREDGVFSEPGSETVVASDGPGPCQNSTDEEKILSTQSHLRVAGSTLPPDTPTPAPFSLDNRPYLEAVFHALECTENDYEALFALCLLYAMGHNEGINQGLMDQVSMTTDRSETKDTYNVTLVERLIRVITLATQPGSKVRLCTLELTIRLLKQLVLAPDRSYLQDRHLASIENARECGTQLLRNFYKSEEIFLDMFEDEYREMKSRPLNVEYLTMDASILLPPTGTPLTGIDFNKRLPCGEVERARRAIRVFFLIRDLSLDLMQEPEQQLPLTKDADCVKIDNILDLNNSDLIACTVVTKDKRQKRFLVIDALQMILVEPDVRRLGWGIVTFVGFLQNIEVTGDKEDSRSLHITVHKPATSHHVRPVPLLSGRFIFDDHIRCMAAKQRLTKGRLKARQQKMQMIERLLDITAETPPAGSFSKMGSYPGRSHPVRLSGSDKRTHPSSRQPGVSSEPGSSQTRATGSIHVEQGSETTDTDSPSGSGTDSTMLVEDTLDQGEEIEMAEEATSEMAFQTLHQTPSESSSRYDSSSHEGSPVPQEIPLEDLSRKKLRKKEQLTRARLTQSRLTEQLKEPNHSRRDSQSPSRKLSVPNATKTKLRGRSTSLTAEVGKKGSRSRSGTPERRFHSESSPLPVSRTGELLKDSNGKINGNKKGLSKLTGKVSASEGQPDPDDMKVDETCGQDSAVTGGQAPKTLCPATSPAVSLIQDTEEGLITSIKDSPKLLPPSSRMNKDRSLSSVSHSSSETESVPSVDSSRSSDFLDKPSLGLNVATGTQAELSTAEIVIETATNSASSDTGHSATDQLTKLAKIVQRYSFGDEDTQEAETEIDH